MNHLQRFWSGSRFGFRSGTGSWSGSYRSGYWSWSRYGFWYWSCSESGSMYRSWSRSTQNNNISSNS